MVDIHASAATKTESLKISLDNTPELPKRELKKDADSVSQQGRTSLLHRLRLGDERIQE